MLSRGRRSKCQSETAGTQTREREPAAYLDAEVPSVHVVSEEQVAGAAGGSAHLKELHQVKELPVDVSTHWTHKHVDSCVCYFSFSYLLSTDLMFRPKPATCLTLKGSVSFDR